MASELVFFVGCLFYGCGIWLVAQVFHLNAHYPDGFWWWALGVLPFALGLDTVLLHALLVTVLAASLANAVLQAPLWWDLVGVPRSLLAGLVQPLDALVVWVLLLFLVSLTGRLWTAVGLLAVITLVLAAVNTAKMSILTEPLVPSDRAFVTTPGFLVSMVPPFMTVIPDAVAARLTSTFGGTWDPMMVQKYLAFLLATPVQFYAGARFYRGFWHALKRRFWHRQVLGIDEVVLGIDPGQRRLDPLQVVVHEERAIVGIAVGDERG